MFDDRDEDDRDQGQSMFRMSRRDVNELHDNVRDARDYLTRSSRDATSERRSSLFGRTVERLESGAGAFGIGYLAGRTGSSSIGTSGVPTGALVGAAGLLSVYMGWAGKYSPHVEAVSSGAIDAFFTILGARVGSAQAARADEQGGLAGIAGIPHDAGQFAAPAAQPLNMAQAEVNNPLPAPPPRTGRAPLTEAELHDIAQRRMKNHVF